MTAPALPYKRPVPGTGPVMFLVHGMLSSHRHWVPNIDALSRYVQPVVFDLWGHGDAPAPLDDAPYQVDALLEQFERVRIALGAERVLLCGQSFGASLTLRYSIEHPERVIAQVFTNSVSALSPPDRFGSAAERTARAAAIEARGHEVLREMPIHPRRARRLSPQVKAELVEAAEQVDPRAIARLISITGPQLSSRDDLGRIACPTLLVNGVHEKAFQPLRDDAVRGIPGCQVADIDAGHAVNLENPDAFNAAVVAFLQSLPETAGR